MMIHVKVGWKSMVIAVLRELSLQDRTLKLWNFPTEEQEALALERTQRLGDCTSKGWFHCSSLAQVSRIQIFNGILWFCGKIQFLFRGQVLYLPGIANALHSGAESAGGR
jgi:hypothetical protein